MSTVLDSIWIEAARKLDVPVVRGGDAYVHWDGRALHIADDEHLDEDDTVAQLVLHELCHWMTQGERARAEPDWGLDNTSDRDEARELACVRLQAHLTGAYGLRRFLYPTTVVRGFFEGLGGDALGKEPLAHAAASLAARAPYRDVFREALHASALAVGIALHPATGRALGDGKCGGCAWRSDKGWCRVAERRVHDNAQACTAYEGALDCLACGACCREAYDTVELSLRDGARVPPELIERRDGRLHLRRTPGNRCVALEGHYRCAIYDLRPKTCREFERGGRHCLDARRRVGLTM